MSQEIQTILFGVSDILKENLGLLRGRLDEIKSNLKNDLTQQNNAVTQ